MRRSLAAAVILCWAVTARAAEPLRFTFSWQVGEASRDAFSSTTTYTVDGASVAVEHKYSGRREGRERLPPGKPQGRIKDGDAMRALLEAFAAAPADAAKNEQGFQDCHYVVACFTKGASAKAKPRCVKRIKGDVSDDEFKAAQAINEALAAGVTWKP
jgi:hypothetical protein